MQKLQRLRCGRTVQLQSGAHEFWLCAPLAAEMGRHWQPHRTFIKTGTRFQAAGRRTFEICKELSSSASELTPSSSLAPL